MTEPLAPHHLRHDPALSADDLATAARLSRELQTLTMTRPVPQAGTSTLRPAVRPASQGVVRRWAPVGLSAAAATLVLVVTTQAAAPGVAWSAAPSVASASDEAAVTQECATGLPRSASRRPAPPSAGPAVLPPLGVLDVRGAGAVAVFADRAWTVECVLSRRGDDWERLVTVAVPTEQLGAVAAVTPQWHGSTTLTDGTGVSYLGGVASTDTTSVRLEMPGHEPVVASLKGGRFALWWPTDLSTEGGRLVALDDGAKGEIGTMSLDSLLSDRDRDRTGPTGTEPERARPDRAEQEKAEQEKSEQEKAEQEKSEQG